MLDTHESKGRRALPRDGSGEAGEEIRDELGAVGDTVRDKISGLGTDAAAVVHYTAGPIVDSDELDSQIWQSSIYLNRSRELQTRPRQRIRTSPE